MNCISITGYPPDSVMYCPECGARYFLDAIYYLDGKMKCGECGLSCYIVEADDSHEEGKRI